MWSSKTRKAWTQTKVWVLTLGEEKKSPFWRRNLQHMISNYGEPKAVRTKTEVSQRRRNPASRPYYRNSAQISSVPYRFWTQDYNTNSCLNFQPAGLPQRRHIQDCNSNSSISFQFAGLPGIFWTLWALTIMWANLLNLYIYISICIDIYIASISIYPSY